MSKIRGRDCKLYYLSTGTREAWPASGAPSNLTEITNVGDLSLANERDEITAPTRADSWEEILTSIMKAPLTWESFYDSSDTAVEALKDAFFSRTMVALAILDGDADTAGTEGFWADFEITKCEESQPVEGMYQLSFAAKPSARSSVAPERVTVGS